MCTVHSTLVGRDRLQESRTQEVEDFSGYLLLGLTQTPTSVAMLTQSVPFTVGVTLYDHHTDDVKLRRLGVRLQLEALANLSDADKAALVTAAAKSLADALRAVEPPDITL